MNPPEELRVLEKLVESDGWKWLEKTAKEQTAGRTDQLILTPASKMDDLIAQEFPKGEISGIRLFMALPRVRIASLKAQIAGEPEEKLNEYD